MPLTPILPIRMSASRRLFLLLYVLTAAGSTGAAAQQPGPPARAAGAPGEIIGRLAEAGSGRAVAGGSVTVRRAIDTAFAGGALPKADGSFRVDGLVPGRYTLRVRALGYAPLVRGDVVISAEKPVVDLGALELSTVATKLEGQVVVAEREEVALAPDRNSYSTKNMTTAAGGTSIDVLRNVPSVEVDGSNKVSLRGNENVVVQINGRASPLKGEQLGNFLAQLPASTVTRVEVATNPSAKNDPEGTAGIINIVLNQEAEVGLSGGFTAGTGTTGMANLSGNIGRQKGPTTLFVSGSFYRDNRTMSGTSFRTNLGIPVPAFVQSRSGGSSQPLSGGLMLRSEYRFTDRDALSFDASAWRGRFANDNASYYTNLDDALIVTALFDQFSNNVYNNNSQDYTLAFRRTGKPQQSTFSTELRYSLNNNDNDATLFGVLHQADASTGPSAIPREHDLNKGRYPSWNLQTDYSHPFGTGTKLETGFKGTQRNTMNDFTAAYFDSTSAQYVVAPARTSAFDYREQIGAVYGVLSQQVKKVQAQAGLRLEEASTRLSLPTAALEVTNHYGSAFPSAIVSYNFTEMRQAKLSYSRRISRPDAFQLSPIENKQDARNIFHGNPGLGPEYTDAYELGLQETRSWGSVQLNPYLRKTIHAVRFIRTVNDSGISVGTFDNVASTKTIGSDLNVTYRRGPLTLFTGGSVWRYTSDASNLAGNLSARAFVWSARANTTWKLTPRTDLQGFANYRAPQVTEGGTQTAFVFMNLAVRQKLWGEQGSITVRVADPFNLMKFGYRLSNGQLIEVNERRFGQRGLFISVTRNFGQQLKLRPRQDGEQQAAPPTPGGP
jgi:outer membrane receptor protein involved in Fe transport